jgi:hypothetical protein
MPRGRTARQPSGRNLELYHELVCERRLQAEVAAQYRVSQARVAQIRGQVAAWVEQFLPEKLTAAVFGPDDGEPRTTEEEGTRLHLAVVLRRILLGRTYGEYLAFFGGASGAIGYGNLYSAIDAGVVPEAMAANLPERDLVQSAVRMARELEDLERVARRGPFGELMTSQASPTQIISTVSVTPAVDGTSLAGAAG